jgi:hypothetical protein
MSDPSRPHVSMPIVCEPMYLNATLNMWAEKNLLTVYMSDVVEWTDEVCVPVLSTLGNFCAQLVSKRGFEDDMMMMGYATEYEWELFNDCPGPGVPHDCVSLDRMAAVDIRKGVVCDG